MMMCFSCYLMLTAGGGVHGLTRVLPPVDRRIVTTTRSHGTGLVQVHSKQLQTCRTCLTMFGVPIRITRDT